MINLAQKTVNNEIYLYINTFDDNIPFDNPSYLFGFKNSYDNNWTFVIPDTIVRNYRYIRFSIELTNHDAEDPLMGSVAMAPSGNWTYKLWANNEATLDPGFGYLLDEGQMQLVDNGPEIVTVSYISDNDSAESTVYLTRDPSECLKWNTTPDIFSLTVVKWNECN